MTRLQIVIAVMLLGTVGCASAETTVTSAPAATAVPATASTPAAPAPTAAQAMTPKPVAVATPSATPGVEIGAQVAWDGKTCTYTGPTDIPRGAHMTFSMTNTPAALEGGRDGAALLFFRVDDGITAADFDAWNTQHPKTSDVPPWVDQSELIGPLYPDGAARGWTMSHVMNASTYGVICAESPKDGDKAHLATVIEVKDR